MPGSPQTPDPRTEAARQGGTWTEEEKSRGAGTPGQDAGEAGSATTKARPTDDRARTEGAAAQVQRDAAHDAAVPDPETPAGGGNRTRSTDGSATDPGTDPQAPRNPA